MEEDASAAGSSAAGSSAARSTAAARRRVFWVAPLAFLVTVGVIFALVVAVHASENLGRSTTIQTSSFTKPHRSSPTSFSLSVLQPAAGQDAGGTVTMASLVGKPVVLNMWASFCSVCKQETPAVESVARRASGSVTFVGVDTLDQKATAIAFLRRYHVSYLQLFDPHEKVGAGYGIPGLPVTVFISAKGKAVGEYLGALNVKTLTHYLTSLFHVRVRAT